jgi:hypothetical protein
LKKGGRVKFDQVRQRFRLTPTEKRVALFVLAAFVLGLATKCYRDGHPAPSPLPANGKYHSSETSPRPARTKSISSPEQL